MICTFYSYKGGVGRSMALANVADLLARRGLRVLMVDFDLEAPGLEQFFHVNVEGVRRHPGLLDLLLSYKESMSVRAGAAAFKNVEGFIYPIYAQLPGGGRLDLMPAGLRQDAEQLARYALALRTFDWQDFYYNWEGDLFFEWLRRSLSGGADVVLVDSRTGVTEMGGICGYQLADVIVMLCASNDQNLQGTVNMLRDFRSASVEALRGHRSLDIVVVPARVEQRDPALLDDFFRRFDESFGRVMPAPLAAAGLTSRDLMIPYEPLYAFRERVVSDPAQLGERRRIGAVFEALADAVALLGAPGSRLAAVTSRRATPTVTRGSTPPYPSKPALEAKYDVARRFAGYDAYVEDSREDEAVTRRLAAELRARGLDSFLDKAEVAAGGDWAAVAEEALFHSRALVFCVGRAALSKWQLNVIEKALDARRRGQNLAIIPVLLPGADATALEGTPLAPFEAVDVRGGDDAAYRLVAETVAARRAASAVAGEAPGHVETETRAPYVGAEPFAEKHVDLFFGREAAVHAAVEHLESARVLVVSGPSGCGKTSFMGAGVFPVLRGRAPRLRWLIAEVAADANRLASPVSALRDCLPRRPGDRDATTPPGLLEDVIDDVLKTTDRWLVFVDQAEALARPHTDVDGRAIFLRGLETLASHGAGRITVALAVRSDARAALAEIAEASALMRSATILELPGMTVEELRRTIEGPADRVGLAFEPGLVDRILADFQAGSASLRLGQRLLLAVWEKRRAGWLTNAAYAEIGGLRGLVVKTAEEIYSQGLTEAEQRAFRHIVVRLVRVDRDGENTRRRVPLGALRPMLPGAARAAAHERALDVLTGAGLLVTMDDQGVPAIEIAHEALVRDWRRIDLWIQEDRDFLLWRERLGTALREWRLAAERSDRLLRGGELTEAETWFGQRSGDLSADEAMFVRASMTRRDRRRRRMVIAVAVGVASVVLVISNTMTLVARSQRDAAQQALTVAKEQLEAVMKEREAAQAALQSLRENADTLEAQVAAQERQLRAVNAVRSALESQIKAGTDRPTATAAAARANAEADAAARRVADERRRAEEAAAESRKKALEYEQTTKANEKHAAEQRRRIETLQRVIR